MVEPDSTEPPTRVYFDGKRQAWEPGTGFDVPRVELRTPQLVHTWTWRNMVGSGVMDMLDLDEPPVITITTTTAVTGDQANQLLDLLEEIVTPHIKEPRHDR